MVLPGRRGWVDEYREYGAGGKDVLMGQYREWTYFLIALILGIGLFILGDGLTVPSALSDTAPISVSFLS